MPKISQLTAADIDRLHCEVELYLGIVEAFRAEGHEPAYSDDEWLWRLGHLSAAS
jgi:hypothetical protein